MSDPEIAKTTEDLRNMAMDSSVPKDLKEIVNRIAQDAEDVELRVSEFKLIHSMRMFGVAIGGASFVLGVLFTLIAIFVFFDFFSINFSQKITIAISSVSLVVGIVQLISGILLISK